MHISVGEVFQFFVRATDKGKPEKHSDLPVVILIMSASDFPPTFERKESKFFLSENSATGTVITRLKVFSNVSVNFEIGKFFTWPTRIPANSLRLVLAVSDSEENPQFSIDGQGQVVLARPLNFEKQPTHLIGVLALTDSSPPLSALAEIVLQVQDENDHAPIFENSTYKLILAENVPEGSSIMKRRIYP